MIDIRDIDIVKYLDYAEIEYSTKGENVTRGWANITCPFCGDSLNHCGINLRSNLFHCWICNRKGGADELLCEVTGKTKKELWGELRQFKLGDIGLYQSEEENPIPTNRRSPDRDFILYPEGAISTFPEIHLEYLRKRRFNPEYIISKYKLRAVWTAGYYRFRIIAPVFLAGKMVCWLARDVTGNEGVIPYLNCKPEDAIIPVNHSLYNVDTTTSKAVLVEGITDVWRMGDGFIASFTKNISPEQVKAIIDRGYDELYVMYDSDAIDKARKTANNFSGLIKHVEVITLSEGDPCDLTDKEAAELRKEIF